MKNPSPLFLSLVAAAALLSACGGGNSDDPLPVAMSASLGVSNATQAALNGTYASSNVSLTRVDLTQPVGSATVCTFKFSGLQQAGTTRLMSGDLRYLPFSGDLRTTFVTIDGVEWQLTGSSGAFVDRPNNRVTFNNTVLTGANGQNGTIALSGALPMLGNRPEGGC